MDQSHYPSQIDDQILMNQLLIWLNQVDERLQTYYISYQPEVYHHCIAHEGHAFDQLWFWNQVNF